MSCCFMQATERQATREVGAELGPSGDGFFMC
jgi:hypothetical protein